MKLAIVIGASRGLGAALCKNLLKKRVSDSRFFKNRASLFKATIISLFQNGCFSNGTTFIRF